MEAIGKEWKWDEVSFYRACLLSPIAHLVYSSISHARYCLAGVGAPATVQAGYYTVPEDPLLARFRTAEVQCEAGKFCVNGVRFNCSGGTYNQFYGREGACTDRCPAGTVVCCVQAVLQ